MNRLSHVLRTPITALSNFIQLIQGAAAEHIEARTEFLTESESQIKRLAWITDNLLNLSRLDGGIASLDLTDIDVSEIGTGGVKIEVDTTQQGDCKLVQDAGGGIPPEDMPIYLQVFSWSS